MNTYTDRVKVVDGHWLWHGAINNRGYGSLGHKGMAHRVVYEDLVGMIPADHDLHHLCDYRNCVNPAHLRPVSHRENLLLDNTLAGRNARKTHCPNGHEYNESNTHITKQGKRHCRSCDRERKRSTKRG